MADTTQNLALPLVAAAQAQKHVTHNEALALLDALVHLACLDKDLAAPPASPAEGDRYLVAAASPTGAWTGLSGQVARFSDGVWVGARPRPGWLAYVLDEADLYAFTGSAWTSLRAGITTLQNLARLGVGTAADATNRLAVKGDGALFSWDDVTPGSGHMRVTLNKGAAARDAGLVLQTGFSTRAIIGLSGTNDLSLKVSNDGAAFATVLTAAAATGILALGRVAGPLVVSNNAGPLPAPLNNTVLQVAGADGVPPRLTFDSFGAGTGNICFRASLGTASAPAALTAGSQLGAFSAFGYGATGYTTSGRAQISFVAAEVWTDAAQGTQIRFRTTPQGSATQADVACFEANGSLTLVPKASDPTAGLALGQLYVNSTLTALRWYNGTAWSRLNNFAKAAAYASADTYAAAGTWTKVAFNTADGNAQGAFVAAGNRFVAPEAGLYAVSTALVFRKDGANAPTAMEVQFYRNGTAAGRGRASATGTLVDGVTAPGLTSTLSLAAGDSVEVYVRFSGAGGYAAAADSAFAVQQLA